MIRKIYTYIILQSLIIILVLSLAPEFKKVAEVQFSAYTVKSRSSSSIDNDNDNDNEKNASVKNKIMPQVEIQHNPKNLNNTSLMAKIKSSKKLEGNYLNEHKARFYEYEFTINNLDYGYNNRTLIFTDSDENRNEQMASIFNYMSSESYIITPFPRSEKITDKEMDDLLAPVSKSYSLPADYEPADLEKVVSVDVPSNQDVYLRKQALKALSSMQKAMRKAGMDIFVSSGYRSYEDQAYTYMSTLESKSWDIKLTDQEAARPGYSEHQLGTTIDLINSETNYQTSYTFDQTNAGKWLIDNAHKYGFVLSYPEKSEHITGYVFEPWHWRYIGVDQAREYKNSGQYLNEYLTNLYNFYKE